VLDPLVLTATAFPIPDRTENALAEEPSLFGLECPVVDRLGVFYLTTTPGADGFRRRHPDADMIETLLAIQA